MIKSPCIGVCALDKESLCMGCFRTSEEISDWKSYTEKEKQDVLEKIKQR